MLGLSGWQRFGSGFWEIGGSWDTAVNDRLSPITLVLSSAAAADAEAKSFSEALPVLVAVTAVCDNRTTFRFRGASSRASSSLPLWWLDTFCLTSTEQISKTVTDFLSLIVVDGAGFETINIGSVADF